MNFERGMMMNVIALWILFSTLGAANVMFPEQAVVKPSAGEQQHPLEAAKGAAAESLRNILEITHQTGDGIREKVATASHIPRRAADAVHHFGVDVAQIVKDGSQSGLEKIGLALPEEPQSREERSYNEIIKDEALNAYHRTKDAASDTVEAAGDKVKRGGSAAEEKLSNSAGLAQEKSSEKFQMMGDSVSRTAHSLQDSVNAAENKASGIAGSAYEHASDIFKRSADRIDPTKVDPSISSYKDKVIHASEQAAEIVRSRATEAASVFPNVGQGLAYSTKDAFSNADRIAAEGIQESRSGFLGKITEYTEGVKHAVGNYYESAKRMVSCPEPVVQSSKWTEQVVNKASSSLSQADEALHRTKDAAVDMARNSARDVIHGTHRTRDDLDEQLSDRRVEKTPKFLGTSENLTQTTPDATCTLKDRTLAGIQKLKCIAAAYLLSSCRTAHLFTFSSVYGSSLWVTFLSGYLLSRSIPRQQFGFVQSRIFPAYLRLASSGQAVGVVLFLILHPWSKADHDEKLQLLNLSAILLSTLANAFFLEPRATKAMFQKLKTEKEEGRGQDGFSGTEDDEIKARMEKIDNKFITYHGYSSLANLLSLIGMTWHVWHLSRRLAI